MVRLDNTRCCSRKWARTPKTRLGRPQKSSLITVNVEIKQLCQKQRPITNWYKKNCDDHFFFFDLILKSAEKVRLFWNKKHLVLFSIIFIFCRGWVLLQKMIRVEQVRVLLLFNLQRSLMVWRHSQDSKWISGQLELHCRCH